MTYLLNVVNPFDSHYSPFVRAYQQYHTFELHFMIRAIACILGILVSTRGHILAEKCANEGDNARLFAHFQESDSSNLNHLKCPTKEWLSLFKEADQQLAANKSEPLVDHSYKLVSVGFNEGYDFATWLEVFAPEKEVGPAQWYEMLKAKHLECRELQPCNACEDCKHNMNQSKSTAIHFLGVESNNASVALVESLSRDLQNSLPTVHDSVTFDWMHGMVIAPMIVPVAPTLNASNCNITDNTSSNGTATSWEKSSNVTKTECEQSNNVSVPVVSNPVFVLNLNNVLANFGKKYIDKTLHRRRLQQETWRHQPVVHVSSAAAPLHQQRLPSQQAPHSPNPEISAALRANQRLHQQDLSSTPNLRGTLPEDTWYST